MDREKPFLEHLEDLRWVLIKSFIVLAVCMIATCTGVKYVVQFLCSPLYHVLAERHLDPARFLVTLGVVDPFNMLMEIGLFSGMLVASPFIFYFIVRFFLPVFGERQRRLIFPTFLAGGTLFLFGVIFCYSFILPQTIIFFLDLNSWLGLQATWTIQSYLDFTLQMLIGFGLSCELPLVIFLLAHLGLVSKAFLSNYRRHAIVILIVVSSCITPTSDPYNLCMMFVPMYLLYEVSIFLAGWVEKRRAKALAA